MTYPPYNDTSRLVTDSERFKGVKYEFRDGHLIVWTKNDGVLALRLGAVKPFTDELMDIVKAWGGIRT